MAETAFFVASGDAYDLRWFTPEVEVDLCGHATLATAHILWTELGETADLLRFNTRSGELLVSRKEDKLVMEFPAEPAVEVAVPDGLFDALGATPQSCLFNQDYVVVFHCEQEVRDLAPDFRALKSIEARGVIATAPGDKHDFVCRFFGPAVGIDEDPVTGSAFTKLIPLWSSRLEQKQMTARQISARGGDVWCEMQGERVQISGFAKTYLRGTILID